MITVYGIPNCNSVKKAIDLLKKRGIAFTFHDFKKQGVETGMLKKWAEQVDWTVLLNKKGTTWRSLTEAQQASASQAAGAFQLMTEKPSVIKRPVVESKGKVICVGFDEQALSGL